MKLHKKYLKKVLQFFFFISLVYGGTAIKLHACVHLCISYMWDELMSKFLLLSLNLIILSLILQAKKTQHQWPHQIWASQEARNVPCILLLDLSRFFFFFPHSLGLEFTELQSWSNLKISHKMLVKLISIICILKYSLWAYIIQC